MVAGLIWVLAGAVAAPAMAQPPRSGVSSVQLPRNAREQVQIVGTVTAIGLYTGGNNDGYWHQIDVRTDAGARGIVVRAESAAVIPVGVGDRIRADVDCRSAGFHYTCDGVVRDAAGAVLFAALGRTPHASPLLPDWTSEASGASRVRHGRRLTGLRLQNRSSIARVSCDRWSRIVTPDGAFLATGCQSHLHLRPGQRRPPDSGGGSSWSLMRVTPTASEAQRIQRLQQSAPPPSPLPAPPAPATRPGGSLRDL